MDMIVKGYIFVQHTLCLNVQGHQFFPSSRTKSGITWRWQFSSPCLFLSWRCLPAVRHVQQRRCDFAPQFFVLSACIHCLFIAFLCSPLCPTAQKLHDVQDFTQELESSKCYPRVTTPVFLAGSVYEFELLSHNAYCTDDEGRQYEFGRYLDIDGADACTSKCVKSPPKRLTKHLVGVDYRCDGKDCDW